MTGYNTGDYNKFMFINAIDKQKYVEKQNISRDLPPFLLFECHDVQLTNADLEMSSTTFNVQDDPCVFLAQLKYILSFLMTGSEQSRR